MKIHVLEHEPLNGMTNIDIWASRNDCRLSRTFLDKGEDLPGSEDFDFLIIAGGAQHVWEEDLHPWLKPEKEFIFEQISRKKPILGICFGAQLIAEQLGADVGPQGHSEIGWHDVFRITDGDKSIWDQCLPERFTSFHWHHDCFSRPPGAIRLAFSKACGNQAFAHDSLPVLGLQFHPEFTRDQVFKYAREDGDKWHPELYVKSKAEVLEQTELLPDTYWLMERIMNHLVKLIQ